ncbi:right-handed parallel beta-helix repeat-containing protein [Halosimplex rubrum]|uniref:Right-handed parallel beta-helix repeat-containing protein n=1 Tax=Halosimplex rubrum TaxID=869889 RepID=A0A7D5P0V4_9EURY|nr:right-handed parallel beta-helix repeat-containing protein [Halosimplex rubrum]QLH77897.1 right-handed parallel beta-helix repeat-containing protein [Halosimplex rubrum]
MAPDRLSRRRFLKGTVAAALGVGAAGCGSNESDPTDREDAGTLVDPTTPTGTPTATAEPTPTGTPTGTPIPEVVAEYGDQFDSIVNVVDAGADPEGSEPINDVLTDAIAEDTLVYFPAGRYALDYMEIEDVSGFGLVSIPHERTLLVPNGTVEEVGNHFIDFRRVGDILLDGLEFDFTESGVGGAVRTISEGNVVARNLRTHGKLPDRNKERKHVAYRFEVQDPEGKGLVERVVARGGGHEGGNGVGIYVGKDHAGSLTFRDCEIANFPNNGLYASAPGQTLDGYTGNNGDIHVRGGRYENNNIANVRIGSTGSTVKDVTVVVDKVPPSPSRSHLNVRGIRLRARSDQLVENCEVRIGADAGRGFGAISYHPEHESSTVRNTTVKVDRDDFSAIDATDSSNGGSEAPLTFENVTVTGNAGGGAAVDIADRPETTLRNCRIEQSGADRRGIVFTDSENCAVIDSTIRVTGLPIETENASVDRRNLSIENLRPGQATVTPVADDG